MITKKKQHQDSQIEVTKCWIDSTNNKYIWIDIAPGGFSYPLDLTDSPASRRLVINTNHHAIRMSPDLVLNYLDFYLKFYSWITEPTAPLNPLTEQYVCFSDDAQLPGSLNFVDQSYWGTDIFTDIQVPNEQYIDQFRPFKSTHRAPILIEMMANAAIPAAIAPNLNEFRLYYGDNIIIPSQSQVTDYINDKLMCTINDKRVKCYNDVTNKRIVAYFWDAIPIDGKVFGHFTSQDQNDPQKDGFFYNFPATSTGMYIFQMEIFDKAAGLTYYGVGDNNPIFYTQPAGQTDIHRGIEWANYTWSTRWQSNTGNQPQTLCVITFTFNFDRADIKGITLHIDTKNPDETEIYRSNRGTPTERYRPTSMKLESGAPFPCSRGVTSAGTQNPIHCIIEAGWNYIPTKSDYGLDIVIHMYDFTYIANTNEVFRIILSTPNIASDDYFSMITRAWGGQISYDMPYGDQFMGQYKFQRQMWFNRGYYSADMQDNNPIIMNSRFLMSRPAWDNRQDNILSFTFPTNYIISGGVISDHLNAMAEIYLETENIGASMVNGNTINKVDNTWGDFCVVTPKYLVTDYFQTEIVDGSVNPPTYQRLAYVYRTFAVGEIAPGSTYWQIGYVQCKHFAHGIRTFMNFGSPGYLYNADSRWYQERRNIPDEGTGLAVASNKVILGIEWDWASIHEGVNSIPKTFHIRMDSLANPYLFGPRFPELVMQLDIVANAGFTWGTIYACEVIQGLFIYENRNRGKAITCVVNTAYQLLISGFDSVEINDDSIDRQYFRVMIWAHNWGDGGGAGHTTAGNGPIYMRLFANDDARLAGDGNLIFYGVANFSPNPWMFQSVPLNTAANNPNFQILSFTNFGGGSQLIFDIKAPSYIRSYYNGGCCGYNAYFYIQIFGIDLARFGTETCALADIQSMNWFPAGRTWWGGGGSTACQILRTGAYNQYNILYIQYNDQDNYMYGATQWNAGETYRFWININGYNIDNHDRNYIWFHFWAWDGPVCYCCCCGFCGWTNYWLIQTQWQVPRRDAFYGGITLNSISQNINSVTEIELNMYNVAYAVGIHPDNKPNPRIIMIEFDSPDWAQVHIPNPLPDLRDDLIWGAEETFQSVQINCQCGLIGAGVVDSNCFRRKRMVSYSTYEPAIFIYFDAAAGSNIQCYIPEIILPETIGTRTLHARLVQPNCYPDYYDMANGGGTTNGHGYNNVRYNDVSFTINQNLPGSTQQLTGDLQPLPFYDERIVNEFFVGYYGLKVYTINSPAGLDRPYFYLRNSFMGPFASNELCDILPNWYFYRVYNTLTYVTICQRRYNPSVDAYVEAGVGLQFPDGRVEKNGQPPWKMYAYIYGQDQQFYNQYDKEDAFLNFKPATITVQSSKHAVWSTNKAGYWATHVIRFNLNGFTIYTTLDEGRIMIQIPRSQVNKMSSGCTAYIQNEFNQKLSCRPDIISDPTYFILRVVRRPFTVNRFSNEAQNLTTTNAINVIFHIENPNDQFAGATIPNSKIDYQIYFYQRWKTATWHWIQVYDTISNNMFDRRNELVNHVRVERSRVRSWQFYTKIVHPLRYEKRLFFTSDMTTAHFYYYQYGSSLLMPVLPSGADIYSIKDVKIYCHWREYDPANRQRYTQWPCVYTTPWLYQYTGSPVHDDGGYDYYPGWRFHDYYPWGRGHIIGQWYELIFTLQWDNDYIAWPKVPLTAINNYNLRFFYHGTSGMQYQHYLERLYNYQGKDQVQILNFYFTSCRGGQQTSLYFQFIMNPSLLAAQVFPDSYFQLEFNQLQRSNTGYNEGDQIPCHLDQTFFVKIASHYHAPRCLVNDAVRNGVQQLVIRIEHFGAFPGNQAFWVAFDDITLPIFPNIYQPLDLQFRFFKYDSTWVGGTSIDKTKLFYKKFKEIMIIDNRTPSAGAAYGPQTFSQLTDAEKTYGITGVAYPVDLTGWPSTTDGYWTDLPAFTRTPQNSGEKMRFQMTGGGIPACNKIESLKYKSQLGDLPLLWFNRKTNSVYLGLPAIPAASNFLFTVYQVTNPWPFQMEEWGATPTTWMTTYTGHLLNVWSEQTDDNPHREQLSGELKWNDNHSYGSYKKQANRIRIDTALSYMTDTYPTQKVVQDQNYFIKFRLVNDLVASDLNYRQFNLLRFRFSAHVTSIEGCWIHPDRKVPLPGLRIPLRNRHAHCVIKSTPNKEINIRGLRQNFEDVDWAADWDIWISLRLDSNQFSYTFTSEVDNGEIQHIISPTVIINDIDSTGTTTKPSVFDFLEGKYFRGYYQFSTFYQYAMTGNWISRLRWRFRPSLTMVFTLPNLAYVNIYLPLALQTEYVNMPSTPENEMRCYFHEEAAEPNTVMGQARKIGMPLFSWCSVVRTSNPWYFNITAPRYQIFSNNYYMLHVRERRRNSLMELPDLPRRYEFTFHIHAPGGVVVDAYDTFIVYAYGQMVTSSVIHYTTTQQTYDTIELSFKPYHAMTQAAIPSQSYLVVDMHQNYYNRDVGLDAVYQGDNNGPFISGYDLPYLMNPAFNGGQLVVNFGQHSLPLVQYHPIRFALYMAPFMNTVTNYTLKIPIIQNPSTSDPLAHYYTVYMLTYTNGAPYPLIYNKYSFVNHAFVDPVHTIMGANFEMLDTNNNFVQQDGTFGLTVRLNYNVDFTQNQIVLKWNKANDGVKVPIPWSTNLVTGCQVEYYPIIDLLVLSPTNNFVPWSTFNLGDNYFTEDYIKDWGFSWVYMSEVQKAKYEENYPTQTLFELTDPNPPPVFTRLRGLTTLRSHDLYEVTITIPRIPEGGMVQIQLDPTYHNANIYRCAVQTGWTLSTQFSTGALNCLQIDTNTYRITGFGAHTPKGHIVKAQFYAYAIGQAATVKLQNIHLYGTLDYYNQIAIWNNVASVPMNVVNDGPLSFKIDNMIYTPIFAQEWSMVDFFFQSYVSLVTTNNQDQIKLIMPQTPNAWTVATGPLTGKNTIEPRARYKQRSLSQTRWNTFDYAEAAGTFDLKPALYPTDYNIPVNAKQMINIDTERGAGSTAPPGLLKEGVYHPDRNIYTFWLEIYQNTVKTQRAYHEFILEPREDLVHSFIVKPLIKYAGYSTPMGFFFTMNYDQAEPLKDDEIWVQFYTNNLLWDEFDFGLGILGPTEDHREISCSEPNGVFTISTTQLICYLYRGSKNNTDYFPTLLRIPIEKSFTDTDQVEFWIPAVQNPLQVGLNVGVRLRVMRKCRQDMAYLCPIYQAQSFYKTTGVPASFVTSTSASNKMAPSPNLVDSIPSTHKFTLDFITTVLPTDHLLFIYPKDSGVAQTNYINTQNTGYCTVTSGKCIDFQDFNWALYQTGATITPGINSIFLQNMKNGYFREADTPVNKFEVWALSAGGIQQKLIVNQDWLDYLVQAPFTFKATQAPPTYFLKQDFVNVVEMKVTGIWDSPNIKSFRFDKPAEITYFQYTYCNATFELPTPNPYPYRMKCEIYNNFIHVRSPFTGSIPWTSDFTGGDLTVYFQMKIPDTVPGGTVVTQNVYGSVLVNCYDATYSTNNIPNKHVSTAKTTFVVSGYALPNIGDAAFNTKSFHDRKARINEQCEIYSLIRPSSTDNTEHIDTIVFTLPDEFIYPGVEDLDACRMFARGDLALSECSLQRKDGQTKITLKASSYDDLVRIIQLSSQNQTNLFKAPQYPGDFYPIDIELYQGTLLREQQTKNISMILGPDLDLSTLKVYNGLDETRNMLYDIQFKIGTEEVPVGYEIVEEDIRSEIWFIFQWQGDGFDVHKGFTKDLSTGQLDATELGCIAKSGLVIPTGTKLTCILDYGTGPEDMPAIRVSGYQRILPNTFINILITKIGTTTAGFLTVVEVGVQIYMKARSVSSFLYNPTPYVPDPTTAKVDTVSPSPISVVVSGSDKVLDYSQYTFTFKTGALTIGITDYIAFQFPQGFIYNMAGYDGRTTTCASPINFCQAVYVFGVSNMIYINPSAPIAPGSSITLLLDNVPNPDYVLNSNTFIIDGFEQISRKVRTTYKFSFSQVFQPGTQFTFFKANPIDSVSAGQINVNYDFPFITGHRIPKDGAISVTFPSPYGNLLSIQNSGCSLKGGIFDSKFSQAICQIGAANRVDIYLIDSSLDSLEQYTLSVQGVINPYIQNLNTYKFLITSWYDSNIESGQQICQRDTEAPNLIFTPVSDCVFEVDNFFKNSGYRTIYTFTITCFNIIKDNTNLLINFPLQYEKNNYNPTDQNQNCWSMDQEVMADSNCPLQITIEAGQTIALTLSLKLRPIEAQRRFSVNIQLTNPDEPYEQYHFDCSFFSNNFQYAKSRDPGAYLAVQANNNIIQASNQDSQYQVELLNIPKNSGQPSTYIFQVPPVNFLVSTNNINIEFPRYFSDAISDPYEISCGIFTSLQEQQMQDFTYQRILQLKNQLEIDPTFQQSYTDVDCSVKMPKTVTIMQLWNILNDTATDNKWTYYFIQNVLNPGETRTEPFRIVYEAKNSITWYFDGPLTYFISTAPQYLTITKIETPNNNVLTSSDYVISFTTQQMIQNQKLVGISILFPQVYDEIMPTQNKTLNCTTTITKKPFSDCQLYGRELIITEETAYIRTQNYQAYVSQLINPNHLSHCLDGIPAIQNQFFVKIYDINSNQVLAASSFVDHQQCLPFQKSKFWIRASGPRVLSFGLSYDFFVLLEQPAQNMTITINTDINGLQVYPDQLKFENYTSDQIQFEVVVQNEIVYGKYILSFLKQENEKPGYTYYSDLMNLEVQIVPYDPLFNLQPLIYVEDQCSNTVGNPVLFKIQLEKPPAQETIFTIEVRSQKQGAGVVGFTISPQRIILNRTIYEAEFSATYTGDIIPPPQTMLFSLNSYHTIIHQITPAQKNIIFQISNTVTTIPPTLEICIQNALNDQIYDNINKTILSIYNNSSIEAQNLIGTLKPRILKVFSVNIGSTQADILTVVSAVSKVYICVYYAQSPPPSSNDVVQQNCTPQYISKGSNDTTRLLIQDIDYNSTITIKGIESQTVYTAYIVAVSPLGISQMEHFTFKTKPLNFGAVLLISVTDLVDSQVLLEALELTLRVDKSRLQILTSTKQVKEQYDRYNPETMNKPQITYEICVAPNPTDDNPAPITYIETLRDDPQYQELLKINLPIWDSTQPLLAKELKILRNQIIDKPVLQVVDYYNITVSIRLWEGARYYATALKSANMISTPLSQQIFKNTSDTNAPLKNYNYATGRLEQTNQAIIIFDDLDEGTPYDIYITAGNDLPYDPPLLLDDSNIQHIQVSTLNNYNIDSCGGLQEIQNVDTELGQILESYVQIKGTIKKCYTIKK